MHWSIFFKYKDIIKYTCTKIFSNITCLKLSLFVFQEQSFNTPFKLKIIDNCLMFKLHVVEKNKAWRIATNRFLMKYWGNLISLLNLCFQEFKSKLITSSVSYWFCYSILPGGTHSLCKNNLFVSIIAYRDVDNVSH